MSTEGGRAFTLRRSRRSHTTAIRDLTVVPLTDPSHRRHNSVAISDDSRNGYLATSHDTAERDEEGEIEVFSIHGSRSQSNAEDEQTPITGPEPGTRTKSLRH